MGESQENSAGSGLFAYSGSGGMYCSFAGGLVRHRCCHWNAAGSETGTQTGTLTTEKRKERKNCCGNDKSTGSGSHTGFGIRYLSGRHLYRYRHRIFRTDHGAGGYRGRKDQGYYRCQLHGRFSLSAKCFGTAQADRCPAKHKRGYVSGATYSSVGLISAVRDALQKAGGSSASDSALPVLAASESQNKTSENAPAVEAVAEPAAYRDGVYTGTGTGFGGQMTVQVTVSGEDRGYSGAFFQR